MDNGQKVNINLESPLDTKSSDMLVSVQEPAFAHNRQKFQGHVLPTSLRYEQNGWAAGWYVYNFDIGGGHIFSKNKADNGVDYLAVSRAKLNSTPTYVLTFKSSSSNDVAAEEKVLPGVVQFQAWFNPYASVHAREVEEISISNDINAVIDVNYAVNGNDYHSRIGFTYDVLVGESSAQFNHVSGDSQLTMDYVSIDTEGTVAALLHNNAVTWEYEEAVYIPNDLVDADGYKYGRFISVENEEVNWKLGNKILKYKHNNNDESVFYYDDVECTPDESRVIEIGFSLPATYTLPLHKYYSQLDSIAWTVQGTKSLFNNEPDTEPTNRYNIDSSVAEQNITVYDGKLATDGINGPDVELTSVAKFDISDITGINDIENIHCKDTSQDPSYVTEMEKPAEVPVLTMQAVGFKLPGKDDTHNVVIQLWCKYPGKIDPDQPSTGILVDDCVIGVNNYPYAAMSASRDILYDISQPQEEVSYELDTEKYSSELSVAGITADTLEAESIPINRPHIAARTIIGRYANFKASLLSVDGVEYNSDENESLAINIKGITTNLNIAVAPGFNTWQDNLNGENPSINVNGLFRYEHTSSVLIDNQPMSFTAVSPLNTSALAVNTGTQFTYTGTIDLLADGKFRISSDFNPKRINGSIHWYEYDASAIGIIESHGYAVWAENAGAANETYKHSGPWYIKAENHGSGGNVYNSEAISHAMIHAYYTITGRTGHNPNDVLTPFSWDSLYITQSNLSIDNVDYYIIKSRASSSFLAQRSIVHFSQTELNFSTNTNGTGTGSIQVSSEGDTVSFTEVKEDYDFYINVDVGNIVYCPFDRIYQVTYVDIPGMQPDYKLVLGSRNNESHVFACRYNISTQEFIDDYDNPFMDFTNGTTNNVEEQITPPVYPAVRGIACDNNYVYLLDSAGIAHRIFSLRWFEYGSENWIRDWNTILKVNREKLLEYFTVDVIDTDTGEVLLDHNINEIQLSSDAELDIYLDQDHMAKGRLFYANTIDEALVNSALDDSAVKETIQQNVSNIYKAGNIGNAFFPISKHPSDNGSVYREDSPFTYSQGIAVFNVQSIPEMHTKYSYTALSPLKKCIMPPKLEASSISIFARRTFTHHLTWKDTFTKIKDAMQNSYALLDDKYTNVNDITVTPRADLFDDTNTAIEDSNKYYTQEELLSPSAITYFNDQLQIMYKPKANNFVIVSGRKYDINASEIAVKQLASLKALYLPEYLDNIDNQYHIAIGDYDDVLNVKETKAILNNISDINKYSVRCALTSLLFSQNGATVELAITERLNGSTIEKTVSYGSLDALLQTEGIKAEYSNENQVIFNTDILGTAHITLPELPDAAMFKHDVTDNTVYDINEEVEPGVTNTFNYNYTTNKISNMHIKNKEVYDAKVNSLSVDDSASAFRIYTIGINQSLNTLVYFKFFGIYKLAYNKYIDDDNQEFQPEVETISYNVLSEEFTFRVNKLIKLAEKSVQSVSRADYTFNFNDFDDKTKCTPAYLLYDATDIRTGNTKRFAKVKTDNEYQLIKQQWESTVAVQDYYWIDADHILVLTKDRFKLLRKLDESSLDPWMGNKWECINEWQRTDYLDSESDTFICSSATGNNARSYLYILEALTETSLGITVYDPLSNMEKVCYKTITFKHISLSTKTKKTNLNADTTGGFTLCTYSDILASALLSDCKLTAVNINGEHWLGIQYDKNFNQWSLNLSASVVVHGYGCIGINGHATGGMLPAKYFSQVKSGVYGFNSCVIDIAGLEADKGAEIKDLSKFNIFNERIVGDENQQWYISEELSDIVMAVDLIHNCGTVELPITNKYAQVYASPSYAKYTVHALGIQIKQLMDLFTDEQNSIWSAIIKYAMFPIVWYLSPYTNIINYLQQSLGQYAYTHYNSTSISRKSSKLYDSPDDNNAGLSESETDKHIDALVTDDLSFDVQHIAQEQSFKDTSWNNILGIFAMMVVSATDMSMRELTVNSAQNQSATNDIGKKFSQAFLQNMGSMSVTGFAMQSTKPMLKSEVTAVKTLDMFYSTSAEQNCFAGPGFVNMQFVAQCTAQSVTSVQLEAQQTQIFMLLKELTTWQGKVVMHLLEDFKELMFKLADVQGGGTSAGVVVGLGWIGAMITASIGYATIAAQSLVKLGIQVVDSMLDSFFPSGVKTTVTAKLSKHNYDIEGKHAYGNKSEQFFWPCANCKSKLYTDETVEATLQDKPWPLEMPKATAGNMSLKSLYADQPQCITETPSMLTTDNWDGKVPYQIAMCKGAQKKRALPNDTAFVIGTESFLPTSAFKNENIGEGEPVFTPPAVQDYLLDKNWNLFITAMAGDALWISCKDTKLFDGNYSNVIITDTFCGIAAPHTAIEVKRSITREYLRPWAVTPDAIALNITGLNCAYDEVAYHGFDGYGYRITDWLGASGMNKERYTWQYCFQINDRFKRSNKLPPNQFMGNFQALPSMSLDINDKVYNDITIVTEGRGLRTGVTGENKDTHRYALPIFTEQVSSLPAVVRALSVYKLAVIDGITSLTTDVRISQSVYKIPDSIDFNINNQLYRMTKEYICSVKHDKGLDIVEYLVPALGLTYLGATPFMAYFYNQATRQYFIYQGGNTLQAIDMLERFRDITNGTYDFINQEVVMSCLATFDRLDSNVKDDTDETDNIIIPVLRHNKVGGEITPPIKTIFDTASGFKVVSLASGLAFQGPNRCIINRFIWSQYMLEDIKKNKGKWEKVPREEYHPFRKYVEKYEDVTKQIVSEHQVKGWTHNPFLLVTSPLGLKEEADCKFEWEITFAWTKEMEEIYERDEYVTVNVMAETMSVGGKVVSRPTHLFLTKELFARSNNFGYYSFRYQSNNGIGNRERLHIWSDGYIAISSLQLEYKVVTERRTTPLIIQEDIKGMKEM